ncbi:MAG TPA: SDR family oxidoreductase [Solirubrobacteraceae bacterium]|jgi:NADH dehydrogenase|nr:SDR family oxidoreductase [Solirubrobacteraceae bacterium]
MIAVAGGTGRLGTRVVKRLAARGLDVRVLTRSPARARHLEACAAEIVTCDVRDRGSLQAALVDAATIVSAVQGFAGPGAVSPQSVDCDGNANLIDAAAAVRADVVLLSVVGASSEHPMDLFRAKYAAEQHLRASSVAWTIVRATAFVELWAEIMRKPLVFGRGDNPINFVSVEDVAATVERAVTDSGERGRVIEVGGPENLTFNQLAALLEGKPGRPSRVRHVPPGVLRAMSPFVRQARAAIAMDTLDMTFDAAAAQAYGAAPMTDVRAALARADAESPVTTSHS